MNLLNIVIKNTLNKYSKLKSLIFILVILNIGKLVSNETETGKLKKLVGIDLEKNDFMGSSVAISNNYAVVSVFGDNAKEDDDNYLRRNGSVALYKLVENEWKLIKTLVPNSSRDFDAFGYSISIDGEYVVIGAPYEDSFSVQYNVKKNRTGAIYIFKKDYGGIDNWGEIKKITPTVLLEHINFGNSVAISDNNIIVGAFKDFYDYPEYGLYESGSAYIYEKNTGGTDNWGEVKKITASDKNISDYFGYSVAIYQDNIIVGAFGNDIGADNKNREAGAAYIYQKDYGGLNNWGEVKKLIASDAGFYNMFGYSVAINKDFAVIGSPFVDNDYISPNKINRLSSAYIFEKNSGGENNWGEMKKLIPNSIDLVNGFGSSVAINGDYIVIGSPEENFDNISQNRVTEAGATYIYKKNYGGIGNWGQYKKLVSYNRYSKDNFGFAVAISDSNIIVGTPYDDFIALNNNIVENSGSAYIYKLNAFDTIYNINSNQNIHLYPNPTNYLLNIELAETKNYKTISVYNVIGIEVYSSTINNKYLTLNTLELSNGIYYLYISNELNEYITQSFIVNK